MPESTRRVVIRIPTAREQLVALGLSEFPWPSYHKGLAPTTSTLKTWRSSVAFWATML
jgi:hypothetical protein